MKAEARRASPCAMGRVGVKAEAQGASPCAKGRGSRREGTRLKASLQLYCACMCAVAQRRVESGGCVHSNKMLITIDVRVNSGGNVQ